MIPSLRAHTMRRALPVRSPRFICASSAAILLASFARHASAADGTFTGLNGGFPNSNWSDTGAWLNGIVADGDGATANFSTLDVLGLSAIHLDTPRTIGKLNFGDADPTT